MNKRSVIHTNTHLGRRLIFLPFYSYTIWRNPYTFRQNPIQFGETTAFARLYGGFAKKYGFAKSYRVLPDCIGVSPNCIRLSPKGSYFLAKNPRTEVHPLPNVKLPLKTQENNVTFRPMYFQECRIYGLCEVSATLSTEN